MKTVRFHAHGGVDQLVLEDVPDPTIGPGEVLVRVKACALNYLDIWQRRGMPGIRIPLPHIPGSDVAGTVERVGPGVQSLKEGDKTLICPGLSCMRCGYCLRGSDNYCRHYSILGYMTDGGYAEFVKVPAVNVFPYPEDLDYCQAASIPLVFMTAWEMLVTKCRIQPLEEILVLGASSGVGSAAIQIAKYFHARVITTATDEEKAAKALELGADHVVDLSRSTLRDEVKRITGNRGVDIIFEHVGAAVWDDCLASRAPHGRLITCGATTGPEVRLNLRHLFAKQISILGSYMGSKEDLLRVLELIRTGKIRPVVSEVFPLASAALAHTALESGKHFGKVVLKIDV